MKRVYDIGEDSNTIYFSMKIGTAGTAYTSVYLAQSGGQQTKLTESDSNSGDIAECNIGTAGDLRNAYLLIAISLDLNSIEEKYRDQAIKNLVIRYFMKGGVSGNQVYNHDTDDIIVIPGGKVLITKPIELR